MNIFTNRKNKKLCIGIATGITAVSVLAGACALYVSDYYRADADSINAFVYSGGFAETYLEDGSIAFVPENATTGFVFYPGGKVEYTAYLPLMRAIASNGVLCVLTKMPANLAILDTDACEETLESYSEIESWYIGGHSLGGSAAAFYVESNPEVFDGLILLASYSSADISSLNLPVLSVYGSEDKVMNAKKYEQYKKNLPESFTEKKIKGGCHSYFGYYGMQKGDGDPTITAQQQIDRTAEYIRNFLK